MKASIQAVAAEAGVSISTVSRTFAKPNLVLPETRSKVMAAAEKLDYRISRSAAALKTGQSFRVALLMSDPISTWFNSNTYAGLDSVLHPAGYDISIFEMADAHDRHEFFATLPVRRNVDAVIVNSFNIVPEEVEKLSNMKVPIVGINIPSINGFNATVSIDDRQAMHVAVEHLFSMGHRRIAYAYETSNDNNQNMVFSAEARLHGLMETAEKRKMAVNASQSATMKTHQHYLNSLLTMDPAPPHRIAKVTSWHCLSSISCASRHASLKSSRSSDSTTYDLPQKTRPDHVRITDSFKRWVKNVRT